MANKVSIKIKNSFRQQKPKLATENYRYFLILKKKTVSLDLDRDQQNDPIDDGVTT